MLSLTIQPEEILARSWTNLWELYEERFSRRNGPLWVFRGHEKIEWRLETVLDRYRHRLPTETPAQLIEEGLVRQFQRVARNTRVAHFPKAKNLLEWLALMRHYGAPTRLLDWTYSIAVALLFAVESAQREKDCAIWAINATWCNERSIAVLAKGIGNQSEDDVRNAFDSDPYMQENFPLYFCRMPPVGFIYRINPYLMNERLSAQQGLFLCPGDVTETFEHNLAALATQATIRENLVKIMIPSCAHRDILEHLHGLNMTMEQLFPGMDGLARSLQSRLALPHTLIPNWRKRRWKSKPEHFKSWHQD